MTPRRPIRRKARRADVVGFVLPSEGTLARLLIAGDLSEEAVTLAVNYGVFKGDKLTGIPNKTKGYEWSDWEALRDTINKGGVGGGKMCEREVLDLLEGYTDRDWDMLAAWTTCRVKRSAVVAGALRAHTFKADDAKKAGAVPPFAANQRANKGSQIALGALEFVCKALDRIESLWSAAKPGSGGRLSYQESVKDLQPELTVDGSVRWALGAGDNRGVDGYVWSYIALNYPGADLSFVLGEIAWWYRQVGLPLPAPEDSWALLKGFCPHTVAEAMYLQQESPEGAEIEKLDSYSLKAGDRGAKIVWGPKQVVVPGIVPLPHPDKGGDLSKSPYQLWDMRARQLRLIEAQLEAPSSLTARGVEQQFSEAILTGKEYRLLLEEAEERGSKALKVAIETGDPGSVGRPLAEKAVTLSAALEARAIALREKDAQTAKGAGAVAGGVVRRLGAGKSLIFGATLAVLGTAIPVIFSFKSNVVDIAARGLYPQYGRVVADAILTVVFVGIGLFFIGWKILPKAFGFIRGLFGR